MENAWLTVAMVMAATSLRAASHVTAMGWHPAQCGWRSRRCVCEKTKTVRPLSDTKATPSLAVYAAVIPFLLSCCS